VKHISVIACMLDAGESLIPYIVISQNSSPVQKQLRKHSIRFGRDFCLEIQSQAIHQCRDLSRFNQNRVLNVFCWASRSGRICRRGRSLLDR
jgi:hypothetical protein